MDATAEYKCFLLAFDILLSKLSISRDKQAYRMGTMLKSTAICHITGIVHEIL